MKASLKRERATRAAPMPKRMMFIGVKAFWTRMRV